MSIEAMKQALEALESNGHDWHIKERKAKEALRQAIAEAEKQEPYGYLKLSNAKFYQEVEGVPNIEQSPDYLPLYTHPPQRSEDAKQPKREPLTVDAVAFVLSEHPLLKGLAEVDRYEVMQLVRIVETAHGIKWEA